MCTTHWMALRACEIRRFAVIHSLHRSWSFLALHAFYRQLQVDRRVDLLFLHFLFPWCASCCHRCILLLIILCSDILTLPIAVCRTGIFWLMRPRHRHALYAWLT